MKFGVLIALVGIATAARLNQLSIKEEEATEEVSVLPPSGDAEPNESQKKLMAEIAAKGRKIKATMKEVDEENLKDATKTNKDKAKDVKAQKFAEAVAAKMKEKQLDDEMTSACATKRAAEAAAHLEKEKEMEALRLSLRPKPDAENWTMNMPAEILNGSKFGGSAPLKWAYMQKEAPKK